MHDVHPDWPVTAGASQREEAHLEVRTSVLHIALTAALTPFLFFRSFLFSVTFIYIEINFLEVAVFR